MTILREYNCGVLELSNRQISVFLENMENPFSDWQPVNIDQGFTYRIGAIGIMTVSNYGQISVNVDSSLAIIREAERVLVLTFTVDSGKTIEIGTITQSVKYRLKQGKYSVLIQLGSDKEGMDWLNLSFVSPQNLDPTPRYLKADKTINRLVDFNLAALPAVNDSGATMHRFA